jgi:holliday junction DNA helicase RuvB
VALSDDRLDPRPVAPGAAPEEAAADVALRPQSLDEFIGQDKLKDNLKIFIQAAQSRK